MENQKNDNLNLLEAVVQNTEMGKNTLEQIVPMTEEPRFKGTEPGGAHGHHGLRRHGPGPEHHGKAQHQNGHQHEDPDR